VGEHRVKRGWRRVPLLVRVGALGAAGLGVLLAVGQTNADPSFGLFGSGNVLRPADYQPSGAPGGTAPQGTPVTALSASALGVPGVTIDGLSFGNDDPTAGDTFVAFSVDGTTAGYPLATYDVYAEALGADAAAAADIFAIASPVGDLDLGGPGCGPAMPNRLLIDGDGLLGTGSPRADAPGIGLDEDPPGPPGTSGRAELSYLDMSGAVVVDTEASGPDGDVDAPVFISVPDGTSDFGLGAPSGADIYVKPGAGALATFADAVDDLGLSAGDDIDALAVFDAGSNGTLAAGDIIVFSLAPGSPALDDLLTNCQGSGDATEADLWVWTYGGGVEPYLDAEQLGLCVTRSYGLCNPFSGSGNDNVDAIDLVTAAGTDLDGDGIDDAVDPDDNGNGIGDGVADPCPADPDGDCVTASDNCPSVYNPAQTDSDRYLGNGPDINGANDDGTVPMGDSTGNACDDDNDNDGLADAIETSGAPCASATGPTSSLGDITWVGGHPTSRDSDGDAVLDGAECALGTNPNSAASKPSATACGGTGDDDGDGLLNKWETCAWGTSNASTNSDGAGAGDCKEAADIDGDGVLTFPGDVMGVANAYYGSVIQDVTMDIDGDGLITYPGDVLTIAGMFYGSRPCL